MESDEMPNVNYEVDTHALHIAIPKSKSVLEGRCILSIKKDNNNFRTTADMATKGIKTARYSMGAVRGKRKKNSSKEDEYMRTITSGSLRCVSAVRSGR